MNTTRLHNLLLYALIASLIYLPLAFGSNRPMYWWPGELMIQLTAAGALVLVFLRDKPLPSAFKAARIPIALFIIFLVIQTTLQFVFNHSIDRQATNQQLIKTVCLFQIFCLSLLLLDSRSKLKLLVGALVLSGTFQAVYGSMMTITGTDYIWNQPKEFYKGVATGTFINRNHLAGYLEMTLALGIGLLIANLQQGRTLTWRQRLRGWVNTLLGEKVRVRIYLALMVIGLILTQSRMGNTAFFASMMLAGGLGLVLFRRSSRGVVILFASLLIIDTFLMGTFFGIDKLQDRIQRTNVEVEERVQVNKLSLERLKVHFIVGTGLGSWYTDFPIYRDREILLQYRHAHSDLIEFPSELGIVGILPLALILLHSFTRSIKVQISRKSQFMRAMGFSATMAVIAILLHSITDFNLQIFANSATFIVILALPYIASSIGSGRNSHT